jgi:hypothetical protein
MPVVMVGCYRAPLTPAGPLAWDTRLMTAAGVEATTRRGLRVLLLAALAALAALLLPATPASAATAPAAEKGVGAHHLQTILTVGVAQHIAAGQGRARAPSQWYLVSGHCVAAEDGGALLRLSSEDSWGNPSTLARHFRDHGADFGATTAEDYASQASKFFQRGIQDGLPIKIDEEGVIRIYDPETNTFGAFNPNGTTRTFFKPTSPTYWSRQPGSSPWGP